MTPTMIRKHAIAITAAGLLASASAGAANLTVVHGIAGDDLGVDPALPVDVSVNGTCLLTAFEFGGIAGPVEVDAGGYDVEIRLADSENPCQGALALSQSVTLALGENASAVAHYTTEGSISLSKFTNDVRSTADGQTRVIVRHLADAPNVDVVYEAGGQIVAEIEDLAFEQQGKRDVDAGVYQVSVKVAGTDITALGPYEVGTSPSVVNLGYVVGSVGGGTLISLFHTIEL